MTDLDDRLSELLSRSADAVEVRPDLDAVLADDGRGDHGAHPVVDVRDRPRRTRRVLTLAAALLVVLAVVGAVALNADDDEPLGVTDAPLSADDRFPVFGPLPAALQDRPVEAEDGEGSHQNAMTSNFLPGTPLVSAAIGQVDDEGSVDDVIALVAGAEGLEDRVGPPLGEVEEIAPGYRMASMAANAGWVELYGPGTTVLVVGGPHVTDLVREIAGTGLTATVGPDGRPVLTLRDLPDGYSVTAPPTPPEERRAEIAIDSEGPVVEGQPPAPNVLVEAGVGEPRLAVSANSAGGSYRPTDVGGSPGYISATEDLSVVAWTASNGVHLRLITDLDEDGALSIARGLRLVDEDEWRAIYGDAEDGVGTTTAEPTTTAVEPSTSSEAGPTTTTPAARTGDEAEIDAAFHAAFDADRPEEERFAAVEDGPALVEAGREAVGRFPAAADSISVTVHDVDVVEPDRATVVFELVYDDAQLLGRQTGEAVLIDGAWKVTRETRCAIIRQAGVACP